MRALVRRWPLEPKAWLLTISRVALALYGGAPAEALQRVVEEHLRPFARFAHVTHVRHLSATNNCVANLLEAYRGDLYKVFRNYCTDGSLNKMGRVGFQRFLDQSAAAMDAESGKKQAQAPSFGAAAQSKVLKDRTFADEVFFCHAYVSKRADPQF